MASTFEVTRTRVIDAPADRLFALVNSFEQWLRWSPWEGRDPNITRGYSGPEAGVGAAYAWSGNRKAGAGRMEITASESNETIDMDLQFTKPFKADNTLRFEFRSLGSGTEVTWRMSGPSPLLFRALGPVFTMDKLVGKDFETGLEQLEFAARLNTDA